MMKYNLEVTYELIDLKEDMKILENHIQIQWQ